MSATGEAYILPVEALPVLRGAPTVGEFVSELQSRATEVVHYGWSGYVLATLFAYLEDCGIDLDSGDELGAHGTALTGGVAVVLAAAELDSIPVDPAELQTYYEEFNAASADGVGAAMVDGIAFFARALAAADDAHVALVVIG